MDEVRKTGPKDVFLQLLSIIGLYVSVIGLGALVFELINLYLPDVLSGSFGRYAYQSLRRPLSVLTIVWPLFVWLSWYLARDLALYPEKKDLKTRRWLIGFTLFLTAIVIAGDLAAVIYSFLEGELTLRFFLKALTVLVIAAAVFIHYLLQPKIFDWLVVVFVAAAVIFGFFTAGSPLTERLRRLDDRRWADLRIIQGELINYWRQKEELPENLAKFGDDLRGFKAPVDPETGESYEYRVTGPSSFELCAVFQTSNKDKENLPPPLYYEGGYEGSWLHDAGRTCFNRTIDPEFYPPYGKEAIYPGKPLR